MKFSFFALSSILDQIVSRIQKFAGDVEPTPIDVTDQLFRRGGCQSTAFDGVDHYPDRPGDICSEA